METRTRLTKDMIARHVRSKVVKTLIEHTVALLLWLLVFAAVFCTLYLLLDSLWALTVFALPILWHACIVSSSVSKLQKLKKGIFSVVEDKLYGTEEGKRQYGFFAAILYPMIARRNSCCTVFNFTRYGGYAISNDGDLLKYSNDGDTFYLVVYDSDPQTPVAIYNTKIYEWKDR